MELFFLAVLIFTMAYALGSGYPVAFALPGAAIINSPVANFEVTQTGGVGMFIKYQMALFLGIFAITMLIQFVSYLMEAVADMRGEPGKRVVNAAAH